MKRRHSLVVAGALVLLFLPVACKKKDAGDESKQATEQQEVADKSLRERASETFGIIEPVTGLNDEKVALGARLFHDKNLSSDGTISCASCHSIADGGADGKPTSTGVEHQEGPINSPTVLNAHLNFAQFWDGRADGLESQASGPIANDIEMGSSMAMTIEYLNSEPSYASAFEDLYDGEISEKTVTNAIAEFERTLTTPNAPFDQWLEGDDDALDEQELRGLETFMDVGCTTCHQGPGFGGTMYQKMGLVKDYFAMRGGELTEADMGRMNVTGDEADKHKFKVPLLRNIELTAPYFHDGTRESLEEAVRVMGTVQLGRELTDEQVDDLVAFLKTLTGDLPNIDIDALDLPAARNPDVDQTSGETDADTTPEDDE